MAHATTAQTPAEKAISVGKQAGRVMKEEGVEYIFGVTGGHIFPIMVGAGMNGIKLVHCRHEQAGGYAADAYARTSGKVGVCFGTAGPGMTNTVSAIAQAHFCKTPLVAFYGQHATMEDGRGALQECFAEPIMSSITKWTRRIVDPSVMALWVKKAFRDAATYPQGPVAIEIPRNIQSIRTTNSQQVGFIDNAFEEPLPSYGNPVAIEKAIKLLMSAERPAIAAGEDIFWTHAEDELKEFVELTSTPVITRRVGRGAVPEDHPLAFGARARGAILRRADVAMTIGLNLGFLEGYGAWAAKAKLIQITESKSDIETTAKVAVVIIGNPKGVLQQLIDYVKKNYKTGVAKKTAWLAEVDTIKAADKKRLADTAESVKNMKPIHPAWATHEALAGMDKNGTIILDGYTSSHFFTEAFMGQHSGSVLDGGNWAGVGHGVGMGIGAQVAKPNEQVLVVMGDGGMGLGGMDVETAVRCQLPVVYFLSNNSIWMGPTGTFYMKANPVLGVQPDFTPWFMVPTNYAKMFEACGAIGIRVEDPAKIKSTVAAAFEQAHREKRPVVLDVMVDRTAVMPTGAPPMDMPTRAKTQFGWMDPDDFPAALKAQMFPDLK
jgi:acetolactate synthase-1/2/3 large subunit